MNSKEKSIRLTDKECPAAYMSPVIEIIEVEVEKGFAQSGPPTNPREKIIL